MRGTSKRIDKAERTHSDGGFSFTDVLIGTLISGLIATGMLGALRAQLELIKNDHATIRTSPNEDLEQAIRIISKDIASAQRISPNPLGEPSPAGCKLQGRQKVLHLVDSLNRVFIYSVGEAPAPIWRSPVLIRCAPPDSGSTPINQVLMDGLDGPEAGAPPIPWVGCGALFQQTSAPSTIDLGGSSLLGFSACIKSNSNDRSLGVRLALERTDAKTGTNYQIERLIPSIP